MIKNILTDLVKEESISNLIMNYKNSMEYYEKIDLLDKHIKIETKKLKYYTECYNYELKRKGKELEHKILNHLNKYKININLESRELGTNFLKEEYCKRIEKTREILTKLFVEKETETYLFNKIDS